MRASGVPCPSSIRCAVIVPGIGSDIPPIMPQRKLDFVFIRNAAALAEFSAAKMTKTSLIQGEKLFAGLNCLEPGQEHGLHAHAGQEKMYFVIEGRAQVQVGEETQVLEPGGVAFAACGVSQLPAPNCASHSSCRVNFGASAAKVCSLFLKASWQAVSL